MTRRPFRRAAALLALAPAALAAQVTTAPGLGPTPALTVPTIQRGTLPNGLSIQVARNAEVPLVEGRLVIDGGARLRGTPPGLATFTTTMLMEGAGGLSALQLSEEIAFIGATMGTGSGWENFSLSFSVPKRSVDRAFALASDVLLRPTFAAVDVKRQRDLRLAALLSAKDSPGQVAQRVFFRNVYPVSHPYHVALNGDSAATAALDSAAVRRFWTSVADPRRATLIVTGDVTLAEATAWATKHFGKWTAPAAPPAKPAATTVAAAPATATRVILVDKPDAAQSVIYIGAPGVARSSADYPALSLLSTILGGSFSSRLNDLLREQLGYSYGASAGFQWAPVPSPFLASSQVRTNVTDSSLAVFFREFKRIRDEAVDSTELVRGRNYIVLGATDSYETAGDLAGAISTSLLFGRPVAAITTDLAAIRRLSAADVQRAARTYLDPSKLTVVVVGDLAKIRAGIEKLGLGPIEVQTY